MPEHVSETDSKTIPLSAQVPVLTVLNYESAFDSSFEASARLVVPPPLVTRETFDSVKSADDAASDKDETKWPAMPSYLTDKQKEILARQLSSPDRKPTSFFALWKYSTKLEVAINCLAVMLAFGAGVLRPMISIFMGSLANSFIAYESTRKKTQDALLLAAARAKTLQAVNTNVLSLVYSGIGIFVAAELYMNIFYYTGEQTTNRVRRKFLRNVLRQNLAFFDITSPGDLTTRIQSDMDIFQDGISVKLPMTISCIGAFLGGFLGAVVREWRLAMVCSPIIPLIAFNDYIADRVRSSFRKRALAKTSEAGSIAQEAISSARSVHAFGLCTQMDERYDVPNAEAEKLGSRSAFYESLSVTFMFFAVGLTYALVFFYGTILVIRKELKGGDVISVVMSLLLGAFSLSAVGPNLQAFGSARGAATEVYRLIDRVPSIDSHSEDGLKPTSIEGVLSFEAVDFTYPSRPAAQVLRNFTATFPANKTTALVGTSGSGKSTCIGLIERFYDAIGGKILLDDSPIDAYNIKWLRSQIGLVSQQPTVFANTIAANIEYGLIGTKYESESAEAKRARVIEAAKMANAHEFIIKLADGYDSWIGESGGTLSGGQRQRIAIARGIVGDARILLLDEPTAALDAVSESAVRVALDRASEGRTTVMIAHRLSTIRNAHQIIIMSNGQVEESAITSDEKTAHEILSENQDGAYSRLLAIQGAHPTIADEAKPTISKQAMVASFLPEKHDYTENEIKAALDIPEVPAFALPTSVNGFSDGTNDLESSKHLKKRAFANVVWRLIRLSGRDQWRYAIGLVSTAGRGFVFPIFSLIYAGYVSAFSDKGGITRQDGDYFARWTFIIAIIEAVMCFTQQWTLGTGAARLARKLRLMTFHAIMQQDIAFHDLPEHSSGHLTAAISEWSNKIVSLLGINCGAIMQGFFTLILGGILGTVFAWRVGLVAFACVPLFIIAGIGQFKFIVMRNRRLRKTQNECAQMACESASAIRTVAALTLEDERCETYAKRLQEPSRRVAPFTFGANTCFACNSSLQCFIMAIIFWYGAQLLVRNQITSRTFFTAWNAIILGSAKAGVMFLYIPDTAQFQLAAEEVLHMVDSSSSIEKQKLQKQAVASAAVSEMQGHVRFDNVDFRYPASQSSAKVLHQCTVEIQPGQFAAIVGPSGCGKSTIIQLIERFYSPTGGQISVDGVDIAKLDIDEYRKQIALVAQEPTLYSGTIRYNITLEPDDQVSQERLEQACRDANIHDFVVALSEGYETHVGGKGAQLSGGQCQRIAIARALYRNPRILLLDEATSALDSESEKVVQKALDQAAKGRTTIAIAHRLSTIKHADVIFVLEEGRVCERGTHDELMALQGLYFKLVTRQGQQHAI